MTKVCYWGGRAVLQKESDISACNWFTIYIVLCGTSWSKRVSFEIVNMRITVTDWRGRAVLQKESSISACTWFTIYIVLCGTGWSKPVSFEIVNMRINVSVDSGLDIIFGGLETLCKGRDRQQCEILLNTGNGTIQNSYRNTQMSE